MSGRGDDEFEVFYRAHVEAVYGYARSRTSPERASEIVEETFLVAWRRVDNVLPDQPRAWLLGIARRLLANERRATARRDALAVRIFTTRVGEYGSGDPADEVVDRDSARIALAQLPAADRELLGLIAWGGLSPGEAAMVLGCSKPALLMRLHRARRRFTAAAASEAESPAGTHLVESPAYPIRPLTSKEPLT